MQPLAIQGQADAFTVEESLIFRGFVFFLFRPFAFFLLPFFRFLGLDIPYKDDGIALQRTVGLGDLEKGASGEQYSEQEESGMAQGFHCDDKGTSFLRQCSLFEPRFHLNLQTGCPA